MRQVERSGNGFYANDAEYVVGKTASGYKVTRGDGSYAEFLSEDEAMDAAASLANGDSEDSDFNWTE